jgi:hypothetical protein
LTIYGVIILPVIIFILLILIIAMIAFRRGRDSGKLLTFMDKQPAFGWGNTTNHGGLSAFDGGGFAVAGGWANANAAGRGSFGDLGHTVAGWGSPQHGAAYDDAVYGASPTDGYDIDFGDADYDLDFDGGTSLDRLKVMYEGDERIMGQDFQNPLHEFSPDGHSALFPAYGHEEASTFDGTAVDPASGREYHYNSVTGERAWV